MSKSIVKSAKTVEAAVELALQELGLTRDKVSVEAETRAREGCSASARRTLLYASNPSWIWRGAHAIS